MNDMNPTQASPASSMRLLLAQLAELNIRLRMDGDQLRVNAPSGVFSEGLKADLMRHRDELKAHLRGVDAASGGVAWPVLTPDKAHRHEPFPLSDVQHAYWVGRSKGLALGGVATHYYYELDCEDLDLVRFNQAFQKVIDRHDMLRAVVNEDGQQQILGLDQRYVVPVSDLRGCSAQEKAQAMSAVREEMSHQQLPAHVWPLYDVRALRLSDSLTRLYFSWDFINLDAWSLYAICRDWNAYYADLNATLPEITLSYRDYVHGERALHDSDMYKRDHDYWWQRIDDIPAAPQLPVRSALSPDAQPRFTRRRLRMDLASWTALKRKGQAMGVTPSALLLAAYAEVLAYWSKEPHFSLNMTLFSRLPLHEDVNKLVGDFTSLTLLEVDTRDKPSFAERTLAIQQQFLRDFQHRLVSGVDVLREWSKRRGYGMQAAMPVVFTSCLVLNSAQGDDAGLVESFGKMVHGISQTPQVWLDNQVMEDAEGLFINWDALEDIFMPGVLDAMFSAYEGFLQALAQDDAVWQASHPLQLPAEQWAQRAQYNDTRAEVHERLLHQGFVERALARPDAPAIVTADLTLSYGEVLARGCAVARQLIDAGLKAEGIVAVMMPKGWQQIVGTLGVLIAGGAYVPVDIDLPAPRRRQLFEQSGTALAVVLPGLADDALPEGVRAIEVGDDTPEPVAEPPALRQTMGSLAYVIFTSGSTGVPKGVMVDHQAAVNTVLHVNKRFDVGAADRTLMVSSLSFDLSAYDIFGLLSAGGAVVVPDARRSVDPEHWLDLIRTHGVTLWNSAPALMSMLLSYMEGFDEGPAHGLRLALLSGDWLPLSVKDRMAALLPDAKLISLGGATEAAIWSIMYPVDHIEPGWRSIPYGRPLPNQTMHVLNARMADCPSGVTGKIYIGGMGLARGYLGDPDKTARQFITAQDGRRLYDTGDLGRYLPSGDIEFLGREDSQIKLRGHRIELGEITSALRAHAAVREALVVADGDGRSEQQSLSAYLQLRDQARDTLMKPVEPCGDMAAYAPGRIADVVADEDRLMPLPRSDEASRMLWARMDDLYSAALMHLFARTALWDPAQSASADELMAQIGAALRYHRWMKRALAHLCTIGLLTQAQGRFTAKAAWALPDMDALAADVVERLQQVLHLTEREAHWFTLSAQNLPRLLTEEMHSAEIYTGEETALIYQKLFPDSHVQLRRVLDAVVSLTSPAQLRVMEVGAGLGTATSHLLPLLDGRCAQYDFTDISQYFLKLARQNFQRYDFVQYGLHDLDKPPALQGYKLGSYDLIVASSMLHDVGDVAASLARLRGLLRPGGLVLLLEETKFFPWFDLTMGLQQGFDVFRDGRTDHPLLSREQWRAVFGETGYADAAVLNVPGSAADHTGFDVILAQSTEAVSALDEDALDAYLLARLPSYMKPTAYQVLDEFPQTANGKIDYRALSRPVRGGAKTQVQKPANALEAQILQIWQSVLDVDTVSTNVSFFDAGGDSLLLVEVRNQIKAQLGRQVATTTLFEHPTIASLARFLAQDMGEQPDLSSVSDRAERQRKALRKQRVVKQGVQEHV
jgi:amino acid adenylation domain-containing protein